MRLRFKLPVIAGSLLTATLGASATAATTTVPVMDTSTFACGNGVCEVGPGNVGMPFAAELNMSADGVSKRSYGDDFRMTITSGNLPPGLQLSLPSSEWTVTGTPTKAGSYPFTVQFTPTQDIAPNGGPSGTQQLTITIGARQRRQARSDRGHLVTRSVNKALQIQGFDVNTGATYTEYATFSGKQIGHLSHSSATVGTTVTSSTTSPCRRARGSSARPTRGASRSRTAWAGPSRSRSR